LCRFWFPITRRGSPTGMCATRRNRHELCRCDLVRCARSIGIWQWLADRIRGRTEKALFRESCSSRSDAQPPFTRDVLPTWRAGSSFSTERSRPSPSIRSAPFLRMGLKLTDHGP
jgi:hypothetical protein